MFAGGPSFRPRCQAPVGDQALPGSPYHGFPTVPDIVVDGFALGMITDWEAEPSAEGDAYVIAPDGGQAGLVWEVLEGDEWTRRAADYFEEVCPIEPTGGASGRCPPPMTDRAAARRNLAGALPFLRPKWEEWRRRFGAP
jgi:hypothetical protein